MLPNPYLQIISCPRADLNTNVRPSAALMLAPALPDLARFQTAADDAQIPLIQPAQGTDHAIGDGFWSQEVNTLKTLKRQRPEAQLVGLAQTRHSAMLMGEAGADLILFGHLDPVIVPGDMTLGRWWADLFEVACGCIMTQPPQKTFGIPGQPEFYAL